MALIATFVALPIALYGQFESADRQMRDLVTRAIRDRSSLIADALTPVLLNADRNGKVVLNEDLAKYTSDGTVLKLMFQPGEERHAGLGLWIVRRNVEALGGSVVAANRPGGGLSIAISLPRSRA